MWNDLNRTLVGAWAASACAGFGIGKILAGHPIEGLLWCILAHLTVVVLLLERNGK